MTSAPSDTRLIPGGMKIFHKVAKSKLNDFKYRYRPKKTSAVIETLMLGISLISIAIISDWFFRHIDRDLGYSILALIAIIGLYWIITDPRRKKHYYCNKAAASVESCLDTWEKAGVPKNDPDIIEIAEKADFIRRHISESGECVECDLPSSFYAETRSLISKINKKTFDGIS